MVSLRSIPARPAERALCKKLPGPTRGPDPPPIRLSPVLHPHVYKCSSPILLWGSRSTLISSIKILGGLVGLSGRVLGDDHPLKRKIVASFLKCFDEQLDWSLDDIPDDYLEYRALLLEGGCAAARRRGVR